MAMTTSPMQNAGSAAMAVASAFGLKVQKLIPIGGYANFMFKLEPFPIVARVAGAASAVRTGDAWLARELEIADYLGRTGVGAVRSWSEFPPGPHKYEDRYVTFWEYSKVAPVAISPVQLGKALNKLHQGLEFYPAELPVMGPLEEAWDILDRPETRAHFVTSDRATIARKSNDVRNSLSGWTMRCRPLHGDAHHGNLWSTDRGLIWGDFEDAHSGPVEWDLACMTASSRVFGRGKAAAAALDAYAETYDPGLLELLVEARTLQAIAWAAITLTDPAQNGRFRTRLEWLAK